MFSVFIMINHKAAIVGITINDNNGCDGDSFHAGAPSPLGPCLAEGSDTEINFAVFSQHATAVTLELYNGDGTHAKSFPLNPESNRSLDIWHVAIEGLPTSGVLYGYRVSGEGGWESGHRWEPAKVVLDPYAPLIAGRRRFASRDEAEQFSPKVAFPD